MPDTDTQEHPLAILGDVVGRMEHMREKSERVTASLAIASAGMRMQGEHERLRQLLDRLRQLLDRAQTSALGASQKLIEANAEIQRLRSNALASSPPKLDAELQRADERPTTEGSRQDADTAPGNPVVDQKLTEARQMWRLEPEKLIRKYLADDDGRPLNEGMTAKALAQRIVHQCGLSPHVEKGMLAQLMVELKRAEDAGKVRRSGQKWILTPETS